MPTSLELSLYRTLAYFSYFQYPLTSFELWKWLLEPMEPVTLAQVIETLKVSEWLRTRLNEEHGFYALGPVREWRIDRHTRFLDAMRKYRKAESVARWLGHLPWVEGIAVCNSLSWYATHQDSDIDLFIVASPGRVWSVRMLTTLPLALLRQRPTERVRDPICLSFFCSPAALAFENLKIHGQDPYLAYWSQTLVPLVDRIQWLAAFQAQNGWLRTVLPNAGSVRRPPRFATAVPGRWPWLPISEGLLKQLQFEKFPNSIRSLMNRDSRVIVSDAMLKFHEQDAREEIRVALENKMSSV